MLPYPPMKKLLCFLFVALPLGVVLSVLLGVILATVTFCRSFADYWSYIIVQFFPMYDGAESKTEEKELTVWEKHQLRLDEKKKEEEKEN